MDFDLAAGIGSTTLGKKYSLSERCVNRHRKNGHAQKFLTATLAALPADASVALVMSESQNRLGALIGKGLAAFDRIESILERADAAGDSLTALKALSEQRRYMELFLNLHGAFPKGAATTNITNIDARSVLADLDRDELRILIQGLRHSA